MDSPSIVKDAIDVNAISDGYLLRAIQLGADKSLRPGDSDEGADSILSKVPGLGIAYRTVTEWRNEFSPRVYGDKPVLVKPAQLDR